MLSVMNNPPVTIGGVATISIAVQFACDIVTIIYVIPNNRYIIPPANSNFHAHIKTAITDMRTMLSSIVAIENPCVSSIANQNTAINMPSILALQCTIFTPISSLLVVIVISTSSFLFVVFFFSFFFVSLFFLVILLSFFLFLFYLFSLFLSYLNVLLNAVIHQQND